MQFLKEVLFKKNRVMDFFNRSGYLISISAVNEITEYNGGILFNNMGVFN